MKTIIMTETTKGSQQGFKVEEFEEGEIYTITDWLANVFINQLKCAKPSKPKPKVEPKETTVDEPEEIQEDGPDETPVGSEPKETTVEEPKETAADDGPEIILTADSKPFKTRASAMHAIEIKGLKGKRTPVKIDDGYGLGIKKKKKKSQRKRG